MLDKYKSAEEIRAAINKRSFELNYSGGTIWCEHLDGMGNLEREVIKKFEGDIPRMFRPSVSSFVIINLDDTVITDAVKDSIVNGFAQSNKQIRKIVFIGVDRKHRKRFNEINNWNGAIIRFMDDYEKAKEWLFDAA